MSCIALVLLLFTLLLLFSDKLNTKSDGVKGGYGGNSGTPKGIDVGGPS
jgi:hypothetical protein